MKTSEKITNLTKALHTFQSEVNKIKKDAKNPHFKSSYASLSNILDAVTPVLNSCGLIMTAHPDDGFLVTTLYHAESGEFMQSEYPLISKDPNNPNITGSLISYARRYSTMSILNLNTNDDDGQSVVNAVAPVDVVRIPLNKKSKNWPEVEKWIITKLSEGMTTQAIADSISKKYILSKDVETFIADQK